MPLRESVAAASNAKNLADSEVLALLGAVAHAPPLARELWRHAYAGQKGAGARAAKILVSQAVKRWNWAATDDLGRLAALALHEWTERQCGMCEGRGAYVFEHLRMECPTCLGTGLRRHSNNSRRRLLGFWNSPSEAKLYRLLGLLTNADAAACAVVRRQLGWLPSRRGSTVTKEGCSGE